MKTYKVTVDEYIEANKLVLRKGKYLYKILFPVSLVVLVSFVINFWFEGSRIIATQMITLLILVAFFLYMFPIWQKKGLKKLFSQKTYQEDIDASYNEEWVEWRTVSGSHKVNWKDISKYLESPNLILIFTSDVFYRLVPKRAFENEDEKNIFLGLLKQNV